jgi:hypothetical protein
VPIIEVEHLHKRYRDTVAVEDVSLTVEAGEIFGIVGPNGAGKTTTVELIQGLRTPDRGRVRVLGLDPWRDRDELRQRVGVQLQRSDLYDKVRVGEALELFASFRAVGGGGPGRVGAVAVGRGPAAVHQRGQRQGPPCCTSTPSWGSTTGRRPWPPPTSGGCSPRAAATRGVRGTAGVVPR